MFTIAVVIIFSGCSEKSDGIITSVSVFSSPFVLNFNSVKIEGDFSVNSKRIMEINITSPCELKGMKIKFSSDGYSIKFGGITADFTNTELKKTAFMTVMCRSLDEILGKQGKIAETTNGAYTVFGSSSVGDYELTLDSECKITSLLIKEKRFNLTFKQAS